MKVGPKALQMGGRIDACRFFFCSGVIVTLADVRFLVNAALPVNAFLL